MNQKPNFESYLVERNDEIDNLSYQLAVTLCKTDVNRADEDVLPWDMEIIGAINEAVQGILAAHGLPTCWPYHEDDKPCYLTNTCGVVNCPYKQERSIQANSEVEGTKR